MAAKARKKPVILMPKGKPSVPVSEIRAAIKKVKAELRAEKKRCSDGPQ